MSSTGWILLAALPLAACGGGADDAPPDAPSVVGVLVINEVLASNTASCPDPFGEFDDFVELYNQGDTDLDLAGYTVTDDPALPAKATLQAGLTVPAHGYKLIWCDGQVQGLDHVSFKLDAAGESFSIFAPDSTLVDKVEFGAATTDVSLARFPDGTGALAACATPTCGTRNGASYGAGIAP